MKKLLLFIISVLVIGTMGAAAGCHGNQGGPHAKNERSYTVEQQDSEDRSTEKDDDCNDSGCEDKTLPEDMPEFKFRPHRRFNPHSDNNEKRETEGESDDDEDAIYDRFEPIRPHKKVPHSNNPAPKPMPVKPKK